MSLGKFYSKKAVKEKKEGNMKCKYCENIVDLSSKRCLYCGHSISKRKNFLKRNR